MRSGQFGSADFARSVGAFDSDFGEGTTLSVHFDALDGAIGESGAERAEVALRDFSLRLATQVDAAILCHGKNSAHDQNQKNRYFFHCLRQL